MDLRHYLPLLLLVLLTSAVALILAKILNWAKDNHHLHLPPGKLGFPWIGETIPFMRAYKAFKYRKWMEEKVAKYGPAFKTSLLGCPTVALSGEEGNRFLLQNDFNSIVNSRPITPTRILGKYNLLELTVEEHKRIRGALLQFLRPEALQRFVGRMENTVVQHFSEFWDGKESVTVLPLMKKLTFQFACDFLFSLKDGKERDSVEGVHSSYQGSSVSSPKSSMDHLSQGFTCSFSDLWAATEVITRPCLPDSGLYVVFIAGHDSTTSLLTNVVRMLALQPHVYENMLQEHMEISAGKQANDPLSWKEIQKMTYTWKVAQETLRLIPPVFGGFRKAIKDVEYKGYTIPSGWQLFWMSTTHMDAEIFKKPTEFDPSHFDGVIPPYNFVAFGGGARVFPGYDLVKMEVRILLRHLLSNYRWELLNHKEEIICDHFAVPSLGLPIKLVPKTKIN